MKLTVTLDNFANTPKDEWREGRGFGDINFRYIKINTTTGGRCGDGATSILTFIIRRRSVFGYKVQPPCGLVKTCEGNFFFIIMCVV